MRLDDRDGDYSRQKSEMRLEDGVDDESRHCGKEAKDKESNTSNVSR